MKTKRINLNIIALSIMLILLTFCLCGCASVNFVTYHNSDGSICEYAYLTIDEQTLVNYGYNVDNVKFEIKSNSYIEANNLIKEYRNKIAIEYQSLQLSNEEYTTLYNGVKILEQDWDGGDYVIGLEFNNSTIYKKYYEVLNNVTFGNNAKEVEKLFYTKTYYYGTTNYGDYSIFNQIYNYYANTKFADISPQETTLTYSYSVSTQRFHSDADQIYLDANGNYIHTWEVNPDEPSRQICFYTISANRSVWIITCIIIGLSVCLVLCVIGTFKYIKNKKENNLTNINDKNIENNTDQENKVDNSQD